MSASKPQRSHIFELMRVDNFRGTKNEYIKYLEGLVFVQRGYSSVSTTVQPQQDALDAVNSRQFGNFNLKPRGKTSKEKKIALCDTFLRHVPLVSQWKASREKLGLATVQRNRWAIRFLVDDPSLQDEHPLEWEPFRVSRWSTAEQTDELRRAELYIERTASFGSDRKLIDTIIRVQDLVFVQWGTVMEKRARYPAEVIDEMMNRRFKLRNLRRVRKYRYGGNWTSRVFSKLCATSWGKRSFDLVAVSEWSSLKDLCRWKC